MMYDEATAVDCILLVVVLWHLRNTNTKPPGYFHSMILAPTLKLSGMGLM